MRSFSCTKIGHSWLRNSNGCISASFYPLASFEIYVREQTQKFEKMKKNLKLGNFILKFWQLQKIRNIYILYIRFEGTIVGGEVAQLQKIFFLRIHKCICFTSGIVVVSWNQPENDIFDHFYARKSHFLSFLPKCAQKRGGLGRST